MRWLWPKKRLNTCPSTSLQQEIRAQCQIRLLPGTAGHLPTFPCKANLIHIKRRKMHKAVKLWPWVGEACLQPRPHPRARGPPSGGFLCLPHSPQGQRADFRSGGQRADLHRSALEGGGREARVEAIVCMWLELREVGK